MTNSFFSQKCLRSDNALYSSSTNLATVWKNLDVSKRLNGLKSILWKQNHNNGFVMLYQTFLSPQVKRSVIVSNK